jgi:hypothetical protein
MNKGDKVELKAEAPNIPLTQKKSGFPLTYFINMQTIVSLLPFHVVPLRWPYVINSHGLVYQFQ